MVFMANRIPIRLEYKDVNSIWWPHVSKIDIGYLFPRVNRYEINEVKKIVHIRREDLQDNNKNAICSNFTGFVVNNVLELQTEAQFGFCKNS